MTETDRRPPFTRRDFLGVSSVLAVSASLSPACATSAVVVRGACHHDCPDACAWLSTVEKGKVVRFEGDPNHPRCARAPRSRPIGTCGLRRAPTPPSPWG